MTRFLAFRLGSFTQSDEDNNQYEDYKLSYIIQGGHQHAF